MDNKQLERLIKSYDNRKRKGSDDSDCVIVEKVWRLYWEHQGNELGSEAAKWLLSRLTDKRSNMLVKNLVYQHFYLNRNQIPKNHRKIFRHSLKEMPKKKLKKLKIDRI